MVERSDFPRDDDGEVLYRLASEGVDLSVKRMIEFTCWTSDQSAADKIVRDLASYGYQSMIFVDDGVCGSGTVSVYAGIYMLPDYELLLAEQKRLNAVLRFHGTSCDGWLTESSSGAG